MLRVNSTDLMAFTHVWLLKEYERPGFEIKNEDIVIDVGGHIGLFALFSSQFCKSGTIYCYEPIKENFEMLKASIDLNHIKNWEKKRIFICAYYKSDVFLSH